MLSKRVQAIDPYIGAELRDKIEELRRAGKDIIALNIGEPNFQTPKHISDAAIKAIEAGFTKYTPVQGIYDLRQAIGEKLSRENGLSYPPDEITCTTGAKQAIINALMTLCDEGDEVLIPVPCWGSYPEMVKLAGGVPVYVPTEAKEDYNLSAKHLEDKITCRTKALLLTNPNNPTGAVYSKDTLEAVGALAVKHNFYIISDEIYEHLTYEGTFISIASIHEDIRSRTITINGLSKAFAMTGWRVGYAAGPKPIIKAMNIISSYTTSNLNSISQIAAIEALNGPKEDILAMKQAFDENRKYLHERLNTINGLSSTRAKGAFYMLVDVSYYFGKKIGERVIRTPGELAAYLLEHSQVVVTPGEAFHAPNHIRISYANSLEQIRLAMDRIENSLSELREVI